MRYYFPGTEEKMVGKTKFWVSKKFGWSKNKTTQGLSNKNLLSFPIKHDSLKYWRLKSCNVNNHMSIQYVNQAESRSWSFSDLSGGVSKESTVDCTRKSHKQLSTSCHRNGKGYVWQLNGILL